MGKYQPPVIDKQLESMVRKYQVAIINKIFVKNIFLNILIYFVSHNHKLNLLP